MVVPDILQYQIAVRDWEKTLNPDEPKCVPLREGKPASTTRKRGDQSVMEPLYWNGDWAVVYRFETDSGPRAVRCQRRRSQKFMEDVELRYRSIADELATYHPTCLVGVDTVAKGIQAADEYRPLILLDWVDGTHTNRFIYDRLSRGEFWNVREVAQKFVESILDLEKHGIAHGDLQDRNILITEKNELKLIDYDSLYCSAVRKNFPTNLQGGHSNYQHPVRQQTDFDPTLDRFSVLVILVSLVTAYRHPALWTEVVAPGGDAHDQQMLFVTTDFLDPEHSEIFRRLRSLGDAYVRSLAEIAVEACHAKELSAIPSLSQVLQRVPGAIAKGQFRVPPLNPNVRLLHGPETPAAGGVPVPLPPPPPPLEALAAATSAPAGRVRVPVAPGAKPLAFTSADVSVDVPSGAILPAPVPPPPPPPPAGARREKAPRKPKPPRTAGAGPSIPSSLLLLGLLVGSAVAVMALTVLELSGIVFLVGLLVAGLETALALAVAFSSRERPARYVWAAGVAVEAGLLFLYLFLR